MPAHMQKKPKSQIEKRKENKEDIATPKANIELIANEIIEEESKELETTDEESKNNPNNDSQDESLNESSNNSSNLLASTLQKKKIKKPKEKANLYLDEETMNKLRTLSEKEDISITAIVEDLLVNILKDVEVDMNAVKKYKKKNKIKGNKNSSKKGE